MSEQKPAAQSDQDSRLLKELEKAILRSAGGAAHFKRNFPLLLRKAIDEVIDSARTGRRSLNETKINERIYLATKVRILVRGLLKLPKGTLRDLLVGGDEVSVQYTIQRNWDVPAAIIGGPCLLINTDEKLMTCSVGIVLACEEELIAASGTAKRIRIPGSVLTNVRWILKDERLPTLAI